MTSSIDSNKYCNNQIWCTCQHTAVQQLGNSHGAEIRTLLQCIPQNKWGNHDALLLPHKGDSFSAELSSNNLCKEIMDSIIK